MRIEIETEGVLERIYAASALKCYVSLPEKVRALLDADRREGLVELIDDAFAAVVTRLMPRVKDFGLRGDGGEDMWFTIAGEGDATARAMAAMTTKVVAEMVCAAIYSEGREGERHNAAAEQGLRCVAGLIDWVEGMEARITAYR